MKNDFKSSFARQIIFSHIILVSYILFLFFAKGFDMEEFGVLMGIIAPITALYASILVKFVKVDLKSYTPKSNTLDKLPNASWKFVKWVSITHIVLLLFIISLKALFNYISFTEMLIAFTFVEAAIGIYNGHLLSSLFEEME